MYIGVYTLCVYLYTGTNVRYQGNLVLNHAISWRGDTTKSFNEPASVFILKHLLLKKILTIVEVKALPSLCSTQNKALGVQLRCS